MRKTPLVTGEFYHVYNRGTDQRVIFGDDYDVRRFLKGMKEFDVIDPIGSIYENSFRLKLGSSASKLTASKLPESKLNRDTLNTNKLVDIIAYCLNPNHYHLILKQISEKGIEKFMHRMGTGHTKYFNNKNKRSGVLFQGKFKAIHISSNEYLLHLSAYVNLNNVVHQLGSRASKLVRRSFEEYQSIKVVDAICEKEIVLDQFTSRKAYCKFAVSTVNDISRRRREDKDYNLLLLE